MYTVKQYNDDIILIAKLLEKKKYEEVRELLNLIFINGERDVQKQAQGALFILDCLHPIKRNVN